MGHENGGWMNDDQRDHMKSLANMRPLDVNGERVEMGPWYWAISRTGQIAGAGKFAATIGWEEIHFYINGTGYSPESFIAFAKAELPAALEDVARGLATLEKK